MELDKLKWERERLLDDMELLKAQVQEQQHLKSIVQGNLEESIKGLTHEREVRPPNSLLMSDFCIPLLVANDGNKLRLLLH